MSPRTHHNESMELTLKKFHNDLSVRRRFLEAALDNPQIITTSMVSVMAVDDRLMVPGQSKWLVRLSGDFSLEGNSYGIEFWDPDLGNCKWWSFIPHPESVVAALRTALAGEAGEHQAIMSSVLERQNKLYAEFQWRDILAGRPIIILDDNTGSVASANSHYSSNVHLQAMELASSLRQALDESRQISAYTSTHNMRWFGWSSRVDRTKGDSCPYANKMAKMNTELLAMGETQWEYKKPCTDPLRMRGWLEDHLHNTQLPMVDELLDGLHTKSHKQRLPPCALDPKEIAADPDLRWQQ